MSESQRANPAPTEQKSAALPPLDHPPTGRGDITIFNYQADQVQETKTNSFDACLPWRDAPGVVWINFDGLHQREALQKLADHFQIHPLVMEDIIDTHQRPKLEDYDHNLYFVLKMLSYHEASRHIQSEQLSLILNDHVVLSFQEDKAGDVFEPIRDNLRHKRGLLRRAGADYLIYALVDAVVDQYFIILEKIGEAIEDLEQQLIDQPGPKTLQAVYHLKRELIYLHNAIWPLREVLSMLGRNESPLFKPATLIYLRDVYDHIVQIIDLTEIYREVTTGMIDLYLSSINNRINTVMKVLAVIATIFMPLTFISSIYGMNFDYMPELRSPWGYPIVLGIMLLITAMMLLIFRKKNWL